MADRVTDARRQSTPLHATLLELRGHVGWIDGLGRHLRIGIAGCARSSFALAFGLALAGASLASFAGAGFAVLLALLLLGHAVVHLWAEDGTLMATASQPAIIRLWKEE